MFNCNVLKRFYIQGGLLTGSLFFFILPFCVKELQTLIWFGIFHFIASFLFFVLCPDIVVFFQTRPIYVEDVHLLDPTITKVYIFILIFFSSILWGMFTDYVLIKDIFDRPLFEIIAIIGGNIAFFGKIQNMGGNALLLCFFHLKKRKLNKSPVINPTTPKVIPPKIEPIIPMPKAVTPPVIHPPIELGKAVGENLYI